jgi:hypothetical protein
MRTSRREVVPSGAVRTNTRSYRPTNPTPGRRCRRDAICAFVQPSDQRTTVIVNGIA